MRKLIFKNLSKSRACSANSRFEYDVTSNYVPSQKMQSHEHKKHVVARGFVHKLQRSVGGGMCRDAAVDGGRAPLLRGTIAFDVIPFVRLCRAKFSRHSNFLNLNLAKKQSQVKQSIE